MKKILNHIGIMLSVAFLGLAAACTPTEINDNDAAGLSIKVFFPTKVVAGQPMTINGTGLSDVTEVVFPGDVTVTNIEHVGNGMIRLTAPAGISSAGGKLVVRTADDEAESKEDLTVGNTFVSGFSKMDGEELTGGEQLTVYGTDLEFICRAELFDENGNPLILEDDVFYRKGTSSVVLNIPKKILEGTWIGKLYTYDGKEIPLPELNYKRGGGGHWETVKSYVWQNDGSAGTVNWNGIYRFCLEGTDTNPDGKECIYEFPADIWERIKTETFYVTVSGENPQIRVTTGWWSVNWTDNDIQPGNELLTDNGDGTWTLEVNLSSNPDFVGMLDQQHLLFTGSGFAVQDIFFYEEQWIDGGGHEEIVRTSIWKNDDPAGHGAVSWSGTYRFACEGHSTGEEIYTIPADIWERMKTETFYLDVSAEDPQIRITTGWWSGSWADKDFQPGNDDRLVDNGDGTWTLTINLSDPAYTDLIDEQHLLFTGDRFTPLEIYFQETIWVDDGGDSGPKEVLIWENDDPDGHGPANWNGVYRFAGEGHSTGEEIYTVPSDLWEKMKTQKFYMLGRGSDWVQMRIVTGWWNNQWPDANDITTGNDMIVDNGDGTYVIELDLNGSALAGAMDAEHLLFTGGGFTPLKLYFIN